MYKTVLKFLLLLLLPFAGFVFYSAAKASKSPPPVEKPEIDKTLATLGSRLEDWKGLFKVEPSLIDLSSEEFEAKSSLLSSVQYQFLRLRRLHARGENPSAAIAESKKVLVGVLGQNSKKPDDPLFIPFLLSEIYSSLGSSEADRDFAASLLESLGGEVVQKKSSCLTVSFRSRETDGALFFIRTFLPGLESLNLKVLGEKP